MAPEHNFYFGPFCPQNTISCGAAGGPRPYIGLSGSTFETRLTYACSPVMQPGLPWLGDGGNSLCGECAQVSAMRLHGTHHGQPAAPHTSKPWRGWPVYRPAGPRHRSFCFWAARPLPGYAESSRDAARPRRPKTKRGLGRVLAYTQANPSGV